LHLAKGKAGFKLKYGQNTFSYLVVCFIFSLRSIDPPYVFSPCQNITLLQWILVKIFRINLIAKRTSHYHILLIWKFMTASHFMSLAQNEHLCEPGAEPRIYLDKNSNRKASAPSNLNRLLHIGIKYPYVT